MFSMGGMATFPAVMPALQDEWRLSNVAAGWISSSFHGGYMLFVPLLAALSDRLDAKRILLASIAVSAVSSAAFAWLATGLPTAIMLQVVGGAALAGIYMPGLKGLADRIAGPLQGRYISFYTASFTVGTSVSFLVAGAATRAWGWRAAFAAAAFGQAAAFALVALGLPKAPAVRDGPSIESPGRLLTGRIRARFMPVVASREAMDFIWGYAAHMWELFALRAWLVPFLAFSLADRGPEGTWAAPALAAFVTLLGVPASIVGQEAASRIGARRLIVGVMLVAAAASLVVGWLSSAPVWLVVAGCSLYSVAISADSAPLTAAAMAAAPAGRRGATMAVHSTLGFTAAALGTLAVGATLDALGGESHAAWGIAFAVMGLASLPGAWRVGRRRAAAAGV
jgi:MFS family permease